MPYETGGTTAYFLAWNDMQKGVSIAVSGCDGLTSESDILGEPLVVLRHLFLGRVTKDGDILYNSSSHCPSRLHVFTNIEDNRFLNAIELDGRFLELHSRVLVELTNIRTSGAVLF